MSKLAGNIAVALFWVLIAGTNTALAQLQDISANPTSFDYESVFVGETLTQAFAITNVGTQNLIISSSSIQGADASQFQITSGGGGVILGPASTRLINVRFQPTTLGVKNAILSIISDDPDENPFEIPLTGTGVGQPDISVSPGMMSPICRCSTSYR